MYIRRLKFQNFRSFGKKIVDLEVEDINFFLGRNNTGKTNILKLFKELKEKYIAEPPFFKTLKKNNWWNLELHNNPLKISMFVEIDEPELFKILDFLFWDPIKINFSNMEEEMNKMLLKRFRLLLRKIFPVEFVEIGFTFENQDLAFEYLKFRNILFYSKNEWNFIEVWDDSDIITKDFLRDEESFFRSLQRLTEFPNPTYQNIEDQWNQRYSETILSALQEIPMYDDVVEEKLNSLIKSESAYLIDRNIAHEIIGDILKKVELIYDNRVYGGIYDFNRKEKISSLLLDLSRGTEKDKEKYNLILSKFQAIYSNLALSFKFIVDESGAHHLVFYQRKETKEKFYGRDDTEGTGITEMLNFLYKLIAEENSFLFIDEPEHHLHPHSQRVLYQLIKEYSIYHQIIIITHSIYFFLPEDLENIFIFSFDTETNIKRLSKSISRRLYRKIQRNFSVNNRDAIFSDGIIFVEGPSEEFTYPLFFRMLGLDLDLHNLSLINIGGKASFPAFLKMAIELGKDYWFFFDEDALGDKAGEPITDKDVFLKSVIRKNKEYFNEEIQNQITFIEKNDFENPVEFQAALEILRILLEQHNFFIFDSDFEEIFEYPIQRRIEFSGGKVEKALQLVNYLKDHEDALILPEGFQKYVELIREDLRSKNRFLFDTISNI